MHIARRFRFLSVGLLLALVALPTSSASAAQGGNGCPAGQSPHYVFGFAVLHDQIGPVMGDPLTCEFPDPNGTGDILQLTSQGLAFWRKSTNRPTFTNGELHFALVGPDFWHGTGYSPTGRITVLWDSAQIDPPTSARPGQGSRDWCALGADFVWC